MNGRRFLGGALVVATALGVVGVPDGAPAGAAVGSVGNATLEWRFSDEANAASFNGQCNFWSAGRSDGSAATYGATNGNATVLKRDATDTFVPVTSYATRCLNGAGVAANTVNGTGAQRLGQKVRFTGGTGTVDPVTGASTIQWTGAWSINFYGTLVPFWIENPKLKVNASGVGTLTATVGGYASDQSNPDVRVPLADRANVVIARLPAVAGANPTGFTASPAWGGVTYDVDPDTGQSPQNRTTAGWGAWPTPFVDFQMQTGLGSYWYTSGSSADVRKPPYDVKVAYGPIGSTPTVSAGACAATEAQSCRFTVSLSQATGQPVSVGYATLAGTAGPADFSSRSGTLTIPAGATTATVAVPLTDDDLTEPDETFTLALSAPSGASLGTNGVGTVRDGTVVVTAPFSTAEAANVTAAANYLEMPPAEALRNGARVLRFFDLLAQPAGLAPLEPAPTSSGPVTLTARYSQAEAAAMADLAQRAHVSVPSLHIGGARLLVFFWILGTR